MKKVVVIPDSFKGTMSADRVCHIIKTEILKSYPACEVVCIPVADGGEGTVDCFLTAMGGEKVYTKIKGPFFEDRLAYYGVIDHGNTAVIEMAQAAGLPLAEGKEDPSITTTFGVGELMKDALKRGCRKMILGLGGSCTNDAGCGCAAALGVRFYDVDGNTFIPTGSTLCKIQKVDLSGALEIMKDCSLEVMCDIDNPLYGESGAAYMYAPQKGANESMVKELDHQLRIFSERIKQELSIDLQEIKGTGAAGGMGGGMYALLNGKLRQGIAIVLDLVQFETLIKDADCIITGEGKIDEQSVHGKVIDGIASYAKKYDIPLIAVVGCIGVDIDEVASSGITSIVCTNRKQRPFDEIKKTCEKDLEITIRNLMQVIKIGEK